MFDAVTLSKYGGVLGALILAGFGFPIPEEIPVVTAGAMVGHDAQELAYHEEMAGSVGGGMVAAISEPPNGNIRWWIMLPVCITGVVLSDSVLFFIGRFWGARLLKLGWVRRRILPEEKQVKIEANFAKNGILILLGARFTPGIRTPVFFMAGMLRMPVSRFLLADSLYAIPGVNLLFWLAYFFTDQFVAAINAVEKHRPIAVVVVLGIVGLFVLYKVFYRRQLSTGDVEQIPAYAKPVGAVTHAVEQTIEKTVAKTISTTAIVIDKVTHPMGHAKPLDPPAEPPAGTN